MDYLSKLSFQLYSARKFPPLADRLAMLAGLGYRQVETYGALHEDPAALAARLAEAGLTAPSAHVGLDDARDHADAIVTLAGAIGVRLVVVPFLPADRRPTDAEGWRGLGQTLGRLAGLYAAHGLKLAWHNHDFEFAALPDGTMPLDLILDASPDVGWEADVGWIARAGQDPVAWLGRYAGRVAACHLKDLADPPTEAEDGWADVGHGRLDWATLAPACLAAGAGLLVVEHDNPGDVARCARRARQTVAGW